MEDTVVPNDENNDENSLSSDIDTPQKQIGKRLRRSHWTPFNITEDNIERYDMFNTKGCPEDLIFGGCYGTQIDAALT